MLHPRVKQGFVWACTLAGVLLACLWIRGAFFVEDALYLSTSGKFSLGPLTTWDTVQADGSPGSYRMASLTHDSPTHFNVSLYGDTILLTRETWRGGLSYGVGEETRVRIGSHYAWTRRKPYRQPLTERLKRGVSLYDSGYGIFAFGYALGLVLPSQTPPMVAANGGRYCILSLPTPLLVLVAFAPFMLALWRRRREVRRRGFAVDGTPPAADGADVIGSPPAAA